MPKPVRKRRWLCSVAGSPIGDDKYHAAGRVSSGCRRPETRAAARGGGDEEGQGEREEKRERAGDASRPIEPHRSGPVAVDDHERAPFRRARIGAHLEAHEPIERADESRDENTRRAPVVEEERALAERGAREEGVDREREPPELL